MLISQIKNGSGKLTAEPFSGATLY